MSARELNLNPLGTAARLFLEENTDVAVARPPIDELDLYLRQLLPGARQFDIGADRLVLVRELARLVGPVDAKQRNAFALMLILLMLAGDEGSTRLPLGVEAGRAWVRRVLPILLGLEQDDPEIDRELGALVTFLESAPETIVSTDPEAYQPLIYRKPNLYTQRMLALESSFTQRFTAQLGLPQNPWAAGQEEKVRNAFADVEARTPFQLLPRQRYAVLSAVHLPVTIISGGPGTGKTTIVVSVLRTLARLGVDMKSVLLAAPTGKAAYRMAEAMEKNLRQVTGRTTADEEILSAKMEPKTLHRLLGYIPNADTFRHNESNPLAATVVIVDEASMIDLHLMDRLVRAVPRGAALILLGDADQLPSVDAGAVFRDLVPDGFQPVHPWAEWLGTPLTDEGTGGAYSRFAVRLKENKRAEEGPAGKQILAVAEHINRQQPDGLLGAVVPRIDGFRALTYQGVEWLAPAAGRRYGRSVRDFLHAWYEKWYADRTAFDIPFAYPPEGFDADAKARLQDIFKRAEDARLLCATRVGAAGSVRANEIMHDFARGRRAQKYLAGEPILVLQNDYDKKVFNGDQGLIVLADAGDGPKPMAVFQRGKEFVAFFVESLSAKIEHAYAMTVHKSQGSEFGAIGILLPEESTPFLTKEILYTAVTRSKRAVVLVGTQTVFEAGVKNSIRRFTGL